MSQEISIQFTRFSAFYSPLIATMAGGFLEQEGLRARHSVSAPGASAIAGLVDGSVHVADVTSQHACLGLWGPASREILQPLTVADLSHAAFGYMTAREIAVGPVPCLAVRVTYVGELGWELYCPSEFGARLWDVLWEGGRALGLVAGLGFGGKLRS